MSAVGLFSLIMKILKTILSTLNKPFPEQESSFGTFKIVIIISVFVTFFLYIFQPFGIATLESDQFLICLGFGFMTFVAATIFEFVVGTVLKLKGELEHWTFGKWILYNLGAMLTISLANFLFARIVLFGFIQWELLPAMIYGTFMVGIIPIVVLGGLSLYVQEKKYQDLALNITKRKTSKANYNNEGQQFLFDIPVDRIRYIEALQNYVYIGHVDENGEFKKLTERATLKNIKEKLASTSVVRSHRSFLVNREAILNVSGNAQGLLLKLSERDKTIPVSRSYVSAFRS